MRKLWAAGCCLAILLCFGAARLYYRLTDDFRLGNMTHQLDFKAPWTVPSLSADEHRHLHRLLQQKFYYIGKGAQCYAFVSADQQYVLKFFKFKHLKPNWLVYLIPPISILKDYKERCVQQKQRKLMSVFEGYDLAYRENRQESELIYLHLLPTQELQQTVAIVDKLGLEHRINLDDVVFLVQKKGETLRMRLKRLLSAGQTEEARHAISHILAMYIREYQKGLYDRDHGVMHNTGFVDDHPFHLDVGKFTKDERMKDLHVYKKDLEHIVWKIDTWLKSAYPHEYGALSTYLAKEYQKWTGESFDISLIDPSRFKKKRHELTWK